MATKAGPNIITDGLVLNIDPANVKSYPAKNDSYRDQVSLLLDGASFTDKSRNNFTITTYGNAQIVSDNTFGSAMSFDGNGDYLSTPSNAALDFGSGDFTIEAWVYVTAFTAGQYEPVFANNYLFYIGSSGQLLIFNGSTNVATGVNGSVVLNQWHHLAWTRSNGVVRMFVNGIQTGSNVTLTSSITSASTNLIGSYSTQQLNGLIGPLRIVKGVALYTSNFTPPISFSSPARIIDSKGKSVGTLTNGPVFSNIQNGVMSFDGSDDWISIPASSSLTFGTGDFTMDIWYYPTAKTKSYPLLLANNITWQSNQWSIVDRHASTNPTKFSFHFYNYSSGAPILRSVTLPSNNNWYNVVITRVGSTFSMYVNGVLEATATSAASLDNGVSYTIVSGGDSVNNGNTIVNGNIGNIKIYKSRGLSADEVQKNYTATRKRFVETPKTIPGLQLWLDGADLSTMRQNSNGTTAVAVNGDPVGYWGDKSGNGRHATQATAGNRPLFYIDSAGAYLNLNGTSSVLTGSIPLTITELTAYAIFSIGSGGYTYARLFTIWDNTSGASAKDWNITDKMILMYKPSASAMGINRNQAAQNTSHSLTYDQNYLFKTQHTGYIGSSQVNNGTPQSITWNHNGYYNAFNIGTEPNYAGYLKGKVREIIFFNRSLSSEEDVIIKNYLNKKWNVF